MNPEPAPTDTETTTLIQRITVDAAPDVLPGDPDVLPGGAGGPAPVVLPPAVAESVSCPECGTPALVTVTRRESGDFCRTCDYPLFWTPAVVVRDASVDGKESLRRLPGTVGRATLAAVPCPHCAEPNQLGAQLCVRCGRPMHPVEELPPPPVVFAPPPVEPEPEPEPEERVAWWVWLLLALGAATLIVIGVLIATNSIH